MTCARPNYGVVSHSDGYPLSEIPERAVYVSTTLRAQASLQRIRWPVIEPVEGIQDFTVYDEIFQEFSDRGIPIVWLITGSPTWVTGSSDPYIVPATHLTTDPLPPILNVNPFFETDLTGWIGVGGTATRSDEQAHEGTWSVKLVADGTQSFAKVRPNDFSVSDISSGDTFRASGWIFSVDGHSSAGISMDWYDKHGTFIKTTSNNTSIASGAWTFFDNTYSAPYRARHAIVWLDIGDSPANGETFYGDEITLRRGPQQSSQQLPNFQTFLEDWRDFARTLGERYPGSKWLLWDRPNNPRFWKPERPSSTFVLGYQHYTVPWIKRALTALGFTTANFTDIVDTSMIAKLAEYQASVGLPADGIMTSDTWDNLRCDFQSTVDEPIKRELDNDPLETLRLGDTGGVVAWVQRQLIKFGFWTSPTTTVTGIWDEVTTKSWKKFERTVDLRFSHPDGIAGPESYAAMIRLWRRKTPYVPKKPRFFETGGPIIDTTLSRQTYQAWYENVRENIKIGDPTAEICFATIEGMNVAPAPLEGTSGINGAAFLTELYENASSPVTIENFAVFPLSPDSGTYNDLIAEDGPFAWWRLEPGDGAGSSDILYGFHGDLHSYNGDDTRLAVYSDAHAKVQRSTLIWRKVQPTISSFDWSGADAMVNNAEARGVRSNLYLWKFPSWANGSSDETVVPAFPSAAFDTFKAQFAEFCGIAAKRYLGKNILWEIGNEPNERFFYKDASTGLPNRPGYSELFEAARTAIRAEDPTAQVAVGGLTGLTASIDTTGEDFLSDMITIDGVTFGANDAVACHPYTSGHGPDQFVQFERNFLDYWHIRNVLDTNGFTTTPLWLNEWGWQSASTAFVQTALEFIRDNVKTADGHTWPGSATDPLVDVVCYFLDIDTPNFPDWGMYTTDFTRKAIGTTFRDFVGVQGQIDPGGDFSGNGHDGVAVGGVSQGIAAPIGAEGLGFGWQFDGVDGHFRDGALGAFGSSIDDGFTIELWMSSTQDQPTGSGGFVIPPPIDSIVTVEDFIDDFKDQITDQTLWDHFNDLFVEANGYVTLPQSYRFRVMGSKKILEFHDDQKIFWEWEFPHPPEFGGEQFFRITPGPAWPFDINAGPPNDIKMGRVSTNLNITINHNGEHFLFEEIPFDPVAHRHARMRRVAGQIHFETSNDKQTWVNPFGAQGISDVPFDIDNVTIAFINGFFAGDGAGDMRIHGINVPDVIPAADFGDALFGTVNSGDSTALLMSLHRDKSNVPVQGIHRLLIQDSDGTSRAFSFEAEITDGLLHHIALQSNPTVDAVRVLIDGIDVFANRTVGGTFNVTTDFDQDFVIGGVNNAGTVEAFTACTVYDFVLYDYTVPADRLDLHFEARARAQDDPPTGPVDTRSGRNNFRDIARAREIVKSFNRVDHMWTVFGWPDTITQEKQAAFLTRAFEIIEGNHFESYRGPLGQPVELRETQLLDVEYVFWFRGQDTAPDTPPTPPPPSPVSYEEAVLADTPFLFYRLNETSGDDAIDSSGNNFHGFYRNNPDIGQIAFNAQLGTAATFNDGFVHDEWVDIASNGFKEFGSRFADGFTVECWLKTSSTQGNMSIVGCFNDGSNTAFKLSLNRDLSGERLNFHRMFLRDNSSGSASFTFFSSTIRDGNWHHLVVAARPRNSNDKFVWIDGIPVSISGSDGSMQGSTNSFQYTMNIGSSQERDDIDDFFVGSIDEVTIYTYVLDQDRVTAHFTAAQGTGETPDPPPPPESFDDRMSGTYGLAKVDFPTVTKTLKLAGDAFVRWIVSRFLQTPFLPPLVRPDPREGRYRIETRDRWTLKPVAVLPHVNIQSEFLLNRPNNLRFDMPLRHEKATTDNISPVNHEVWMYRDGQLIYVGPVWSVRADSSESRLSVVSRSLESYLETRHLGHALPSDAAFTEQPQELIAWRWIEYTQRWPFGNWCFVRGAHTGVSVNRTIVYEQQEYQEILAAIEDIAALSRGFDWEISVNREFNTWFPRITTDPVVIEYGGNMSGYNVPLIGNFIANYVVVQGRDQDEDTPEFIAEDFVSQRQFGRMEYIETMGEVQEPEDFPLLEARARFYLSENKSFRRMPSIVMRSHPVLGRVTELDDQRLKPGATIRVRIDDGYISLNNTVRSTGYQLTVSSNDSEAVTVFIDVETGEE